MDAQPPSANAPPGGNTVEDAAAPSPAPEDAPAPPTIGAIANALIVEGQQTADNFPPAVAHEQPSQIPGANHSTSAYQGHGMDEPQGLAIALVRSAETEAARIADLGLLNNEDIAQSIAHRRAELAVQALGELPVDMQNMHDFDVAAQLAETQGIAQATITTAQALAAQQQLDQLAAQNVGAQQVIANIPDIAEASRRAEAIATAARIAAGEAQSNQRLIQDAHLARMSAQAHGHMEIAANGVRDVAQERAQAAAAQANRNVINNFANQANAEYAVPYIVRKTQTYYSRM